MLNFTPATTAPSLLMRTLTRHHQGHAPIHQHKAGFSGAGRSFCGNMAGGARRLFQFLFRGFTRKKVVPENEQSNLRRCLGLLDLTALGIGSTLGAGVYVVAGQEARSHAGPAVAVSFLIAALASLFSALCYAEFGSRVPKSGSAYVYSYVSIGELMAFIIGWNLILEYVIGTAGVARAWTANFDALIDYRYSNAMKKAIPMDVSGLSQYPDFFAVGLVLLLTLIITLGVRESSVFNNIFTVINILVIIFVFVAGLFKANLHNWQLDPEELNVSSSAIGDGGFVPFGVEGVFKGAGACFFAFIGFDVIATAGEEVRNPQRNIPVAIVACLFVCSVAYVAVSCIVTLMYPFYALDPNAPLPFVFDKAGWPAAKYGIAVGSLCGLSTSLFGGLFPLPRIVYAMASDGLLFAFFAKVNERFKTPIWSCVFSGALSAVMACLFDISELVQMMSIGTLLAYSLVCVAIVILRGAYSPANLMKSGDASQSSTDVPNTTMNVADIDPYELTIPECCCVFSFRNALRHLFVRHTPTSSPVTGKISAIFSYALAVMSLGVALVLHWPVFDNPVYIVFLCLAILCELLILIVLTVQPENQHPTSFKVPLVPWLPGIGLLINMYLMLSLEPQTWIRFAVWMGIGTFVYFGYGIRHSGRNNNVSEYDEI